ncbi:nucleoside phosphatase GDA1/CD39 [Artemisia annua]|uniref:Nucleoside phosphatase GDA1/CD39 n=1 Tax=Artemisia annua TaxID=35608 RepID=A0A2U1P4M4_ARTAN|nr:nucleoside phosphatase GDA1/CD39 [Artemisia annua]
MEPKSPSKIKLQTLGPFHHFKFLKLPITVITLVVLILISYNVIRSAIFVRSTSYFTVVLDCGSSGTRVNVYEWMFNDSFVSTLPVLVHDFTDDLAKIGNRKDGCAYHCMQTEPGLDKFVGNGSGVKGALEPLIRRAEKWVPYERRKDTPIFVLGTAGLRRLDKESIGRVLSDVEEVVKVHRFKYSKDWIRVLSGEEEAYYGWVALNWHMGMFGNLSRLDSLGLLDLGAFDRTVVMLSNSRAFIEREFGNFEIRHPCLGYEFMQNYTCNNCFKGNSTLQTRETNTFLVNLVGEPNWEKCKVLTRSAAINSSGSSDWSNVTDNSYCTGVPSIRGENIPNLVGGTHSVARFHALSGFFAVYNLLNLSSSENLSKIWDKGEELCSRSLSRLTNTPIKQKYADYLCFRVPYIVSLINNTLCVGDREIIFGPGDVSWTLGAAMVEGKDVWLRDTFRAQSFISDLRFKRVIFSPYFLFVLLVFLLFVVYRSQIKLPMLGRKVASLPSYIRPKRRPA